MLSSADGTSGMLSCQPIEEGDTAEPQTSLAFLVGADARMLPDMLLKRVPPRRAASVGGV
jgi:hypothetical protein